MSPSRRRRNHRDIFTKPFVPFWGKTETIPSSAEPAPPPSFLQRRYGINEEIFEKKVLPRARKRGQKEEQKEEQKGKDKSVVGIGSRLSGVEAAFGSAPENKIAARTFPADRRTTSTMELTPFEAACNPTTSIQIPDYDGPEPAAAIITTASATSPNGHDIIQSWPEESYANSKSHVHKRSQSQHSQLISDSEISVLDLGPSLNVDDAAVTVPAPGACAGAGAGVIQMRAGSKSGLELGDSTSGGTTKQGVYAYGRDMRRISTSAAKKGSGELANYGDGGAGDDAECGYGLSTSASDMLETGDVKQLWELDGAHGRECDYDYQREYDFGYGYGYSYGYGYGYRGDDDGHDTEYENKTVTTQHENKTATISSPILAPLKTTRKEEAHGIGPRSRPRAFCI